MSTKLSFRARALDPSKAMPIYFAEELPDLQEYSAINRAVPQMPSGMEKEEESEHHLQRAIIAGLIIPTPEVTDVKVDGYFNKNYPADYKMPRQMIHVQPLSLEQDIPDYDMDSADESWFDSQTSKHDMSAFKFEQMMDRLEKITVCSLDDAKALVRRNEVNQDVFDYWVNKRLKTKHPLILAVKTENRGNTTSNNPYIAFRRRTEKMQTRKNRKNDETSYEKMLKLRRDLSRAVKLLEMVKRREKTKRDELQLSIEIYEKRYQAKDFSGQLLAEYTSTATKLRPAFAPLYSNQYHHQHSSNLASAQHNQWNSSSQNYSNLHHHLQNNKRDFDGLSTSSSRKEKRQYKKRKHKAPREIKPVEAYDGLFSSDDEDIHSNQMVASESEDEGIYPFRRNRNCDYYKPHAEGFGNWPWESPEENGTADPKYRYNLTSLRFPRPRCIGFARRRIGRGGRILLDRSSSTYDDVWARLDYTIFDTTKASENPAESRLPEIIENINNDESCTEKVILSSSSQSHPMIQNNHHNDSIVIKSENSKNNEISDDQTVSALSTTTNNQKLDDFEQLLDSASASSNIINKKLVCRNNSDISDDSFIVKSASSGDLLQKSASVVLSEASSSGVSSTNGSLSFIAADSAILIEPNKPTIEDEDEISQSTICSSHAPEDFYMSFIEEIKNDWLHFRPRTPPASPLHDVIFDSDLTDNTKKFAIELQMLDETEMNGYDNTYLSQPMSFNFGNKNILLNDEPDNSIVTVKTEPLDDMDISMEEPKQSLEQDAVRKLLEKYQDDVAHDKSLTLDMNDINFDECFTASEVIGCSNFKLLSEDLTIKIPQDDESLTNNVLAVKTEANDFTVNLGAITKEAPIAELQSHNYVLQYGSPVTSNSVTLNSTNMLSCSPNISIDSGMTPATTTTLFQQQFINSGNTIISTTQQQQNKLQPIVYDTNTIVLATQARKQINGPSDRNLNQSKYKQVFMLDLTQGQDKRKNIGDNNVIKKTYADLGLGAQNILVNSNLLTASSISNLPQQQQTQQFSLVHQNSLQKPIILSTSTAAGGAGTLLQSSQAGNAGNKIIVTPASQNVYVSTHGKLVIPSSNSQSIILDSKMISNNQLQSNQQKLQSTHQQRSKMENNLNMLRENSGGEKNIIYAKYTNSNNKNKLLQTVANIVPMQANKSGSIVQNQVKPISSLPQQQVGIKTIQRIQQQQQILRPQYGTSPSTVNFQNSPTSTSSKIIHQPNNGNNLGSVNNNNDSTTTPR